MAAVRAGARVLEVGCGTGALTAELVARGARVVALDQNPEMLDLARQRLRNQPVELVECTASEIDRFQAEPFDAVVASLVLSEMSASERAFVLRAATASVLPGGRVVIADEVVPKSVGLRALHTLVRLPLALLTWVVAGRISRSIPDLENEMRAADLRIVDCHYSGLGTHAVVVGERA
jgi:demethylmenaquinone methyltransferase/2-methoxy-6-polyprenyl-1,4-benzoquinol methylase